MEEYISLSFFADLIFTVGFGFALFFLPIFAVGSALPGTTATILKGANDMVNGVFDSVESDCAADRKREIQIYSATISKNSAHTDKGMFYWY